MTNTMQTPPQWFKPFRDELFQDLENSFRFFWPSTDKWPHENNILISLASFSHKMGGFIYPECTMKTVAGNIRRDAILILPPLKTVIQCELKHFYEYDKALADIDRVRNAENVDTFLRAGGVKQEVLSYDRFGLFLGYGKIYNTCGLWWRSGESADHRSAAEAQLSENEKLTLDKVTEIYAYEGSVSGMMSNEGSDIPAEKQFWLAYFLQQLKAKQQ